MIIRNDYGNSRDSRICVWFEIVAGIGFPSDNALVIKQFFLPKMNSAVSLIDVMPTENVF